MDDEPGITVEDLPDIYRDGYLHAIESARAEHDPATDWDAFRDYVWGALVQVFGLETEWEGCRAGDISRSDP